MRSRFEELHVEARSFRWTISKVLGARGGARADDPAFTGVLRLDANGHDFGIELGFDADAAHETFEADDDELNETRWVRAQSVLEHKVSHFELPKENDESVGSPMRSVRLCPIVQIEFEALQGPGRYDKTPPFALTMPHCLNIENDPAQRVVLGIENDAHFFAVMRADEKGCKWTEVANASVEVLPPLSDGAAGRLRIRFAPGVSADVGGIFTAFARHGQSVTQRVQCLTFLPEKIIPIMPSKMRIHVVPDLPGIVQSALMSEQMNRGSVSLAGRSAIASVALPKSQVEVTVVSSRNPSVSRQSLMWTGQPHVLEFTVSAADVERGEQAVATTVAESEIEGGADAGAKGVAAADVHGKVRLGLLSTPIPQTAMKPPEAIDFEADVLIHGFSPPSAPTNLRCGTRTNLMLSLQWDLPVTWGGCSLAKFEIQMREHGIRSRAEAPAASSVVHAQVLAKEASKSSANLAADGDLSESSQRSAWHTVYNELPEGDMELPEAKLFRAVYSAQFRVRAYNVACATPSAWSDVLTLGTQTEELEKKVVAIATAGLIRRSKFLNDARARVANKKKAPPTLERGATRKDSGLAMVEHGSVTDGIGDIVHKDMSGWSPFAQVLGELFLELGVPGGVRGRLFDLTIAQVEALAEEASGQTGATASTAGAGGEGSVIRRDKSMPILSLSSTAVWVMQTLAGHTCVRPQDWVELMTNAEGLISLAAHHCVPHDDGCVPHAHALLRALHEINETMRQCEDEGFIACTLNSKELAAPRSSAKLNDLTAAYRARVIALHKRVATNAMAMVLHSKLVGHALAAPLPIDSKLRTAVHISRISATGLPGSGSRHAAVSFSLVNVANAKVSEGRTCGCGGEDVVVDLTRPTWTDELVTLDAGSEPVARPIELTVKLWDDAELLGSATILLQYAMGKVEELRLTPEKGVEQSSVTGHMKLCFVFRVPAWVDEDLAKRASMAMDGQNGMWKVKA